MKTLNKYSLVLALFSGLFFSPAQAQSPSLGEWQAQLEAKLSSKDSIKKIVMINKSDAFLLKVYYADGSKAIFKPNTKTAKSMRPALSVYNLVKNFNSSIKVLYTPMVKFSMSVREV